MHFSPGEVLKEIIKYREKKSMNTWIIQGRLVGYEWWLCRLRSSCSFPRVGGQSGYGWGGLRKGVSDLFLHSTKDLRPRD